MYGRHITPRNTKGCQAQGLGTLSPIPKDTMAPKIPAERDKKAEMMALPLAFLGARGAQVKSNTKQRSRVTRVEESIAPVVQFGEGNNKVQV